MTSPLDNTPPAGVTRRSLLAGGLRGACLVGAGALGGVLAARGGTETPAKYVWQIDPYKCNACGNCATHCVLKNSAVKCVHVYRMCGYCELCTGFFEPQPNALNAGAENQLCPTGAIHRKHIEGPYFEYTIDEPLCIGCARCVKGCNDFGNGSMFMQVRHDRCLNCNQCGIAAACPAQAFQRVPADKPYLLKSTERPH